MHFFLEEVHFFPVAVPKTRDIYTLQEEVHFFPDNFRFWNSLQILLSYFPLESSVAVYGIDILRCVPQFLSIITISGVIVRPPLWCCSTSAAPHSKGVVAPH